MKSKINILGGKLFDYIPHCLGLTDTGFKELTINGFGGDANKALVLSQMMSKVNGNKALKLDAKISEVKGEEAALNMIAANTVYQKVTELSGQTTKKNARQLNRNGFVDFSSYHILLWNALQQQKELKLKVDLYPGGSAVELLTIRPCKKNHGEIELEIHAEKRRVQSTAQDGLKSSRLLNARKPISNPKRDKDLNKIHSRLSSALYRAGFLLPENWIEVGKKLTKYDDVIIGLDTNLLQDAFVSTTLLPVLSVIEKDPYLQTPNWLLLVIPKMVVYELERAANMRDKKNGQIAHPGRKGYRALQEIMELRKNFDHKGVSIVTTGEPDGMLDMNAYLKSINDNLFALLNDGKVGAWNGTKTPKASSADMIIRTQFKTFVDSLNLGKGSYFMTSDKVNAAMHTAQGNDAIYIAKPHGVHDKLVTSPELIPKVARTIPLGTLIYELTIEYAALYVEIEKDNFIRLESDPKGQSMSPWVKRQLRIPETRNFEALLEKYNGSLDLVKVQKFYNDISHQLENDSWLEYDFEEYDESYFEEE